MDLIEKDKEFWDFCVYFAHKATINKSERKTSYENTKKDMV